MPQPRTRVGKLTISLLAAAFFSATLGAQQLVISAPNHQTRLPEVIEIPLAEARQHIPDIDHRIAENILNHEKLGTQVYTSPGSNAPDKLLIAVQLPPNGELTIGFVSSNNIAPPPPLVFGREAPERKDDFAWENQYVTYRVYGPALEATGEIASGIDVWSKRVPNLVIDSFYKHDAEGQRTHNPKLSYHVDDGVGLDSYQVGPTRGCGGTGVLSGGKLWVSKNYTHLKQLSDGPVRFEFELTYAPWNAGGVEVTETKRITLDAGSRMNKIHSTFTFAGADTIEAAAGLAIHPGANFEQLADGHILSIWDTPQNPTAGRIATGMIAPSSRQSTVTQLEPNGLLVFRVHSGESFTYYAGSGWSKANMPTQQAWDTYLTRTLQQIQQPLKLHWQKSSAAHTKGKQ
jgi:hypothetical protein